MAVKTPTKKPVTKPAAKAVSKNGASTNGAAKKQWVFLFNDEKGVNKITKSWSEIRDLLGGLSVITQEAPSEDGT